MAVGTTLAMLKRLSGIGGKCGTRNSANLRIESRLSFFFGLSSNGINSLHLTALYISDAGFRNAATVRFQHQIGAAHSANKRTNE